MGMPIRHRAIPRTQSPLKIWRKIVSMLVPYDEFDSSRGELIADISVAFERFGERVQTRCPGDLNDRIMDLVDVVTIFDMVVLPTCLDRAA
jgi:hypothetical protein